MIVRTQDQSDTENSCRKNAGDDKPMTVYDVLGAPNGLCFGHDGVVDTATALERTTLQQLGDVSTKALVNLMFSTTDKFQAYMIKFLRCVSNRVDPYIWEHNLHNSAHLVFKGGNVLYDYFYQLLGPQTVGMPDVLSQMLQRSDADFQFNINASIHKVHSDPLRRLVAAAMYDFLVVLQTTSDLPTDATFIDETQDTVRQYVTAYKGNTAVLQSALVNRSDFMVLSPKNDLSEQVIGNISQSQLCDLLVLPMPTLLEGFYPKLRPLGTFVALNDTVNFTDIRKYTTSFDLIRIKLNIDVTLANNCVYHAPAELIDVTFSNKDDTKMLSSKDTSINDWTQVRTFINSNVEVRIPTLKYLVHDDLGAILFKQSAFPWDAPKYEKRLARFIVGCFLLSMDDNRIIDTEPEAERWAWKCETVKKISEQVLKKMSITTISPVNSQARSSTKLQQSAASHVSVSNSKIQLAGPLKINNPFTRRVRTTTNAQFSIMLYLVERVKQNSLELPENHAKYNALVESIVTTMKEMNNHLTTLMNIRSNQLHASPGSENMFETLFAPQTDNAPQYQPAPPQTSVGLPNHSQS